MSSDAPRLQDDVIREGSLEMALLRRLLHKLGEVEVDEETSIVDATTRAIERVDRLEERLDEIEERADTALGVARAIDDGKRSDGGPSLKEVATWLSRNEVIRQTATQGQVHSDKGRRLIQHRLGAVTNGNVQDMAKPETELKWQTIDDAWTTLCGNWECFTIDTDHDPKRLTVTSVEEIPRELVRVVEQDLDRSDLAKSLVGDPTQTRGST